MVMLALLLTGCAGWTPFARFSADVGPVTELGTAKAQPAAELRTACADPQTLPKAKMSAGQVERAWGRDRKALSECKDRHQKLDNFYQQRDAGLALTN